jgi:uncharacterized protein
MKTQLKVSVTAILFMLFGTTVVPSQQLGNGQSLVRLAERGDARAQTRLGYLLEIGERFPQNYVQAVYWYRRGAEQGDSNAQYLLGYSLNIGRGTPPNWVEAHMWMNLSAAHTKKADERAFRLRMRDAIATKLTRYQIDEAQFLALSWYPKRER